VARQSYYEGWFVKSSVVEISRFNVPLEADSSACV
jgi:hypothetical protein